MDLSYTDEELAFRDEVRAFMRDELPKEMSDKIRLGEELGKEGQEKWHAILNSKGWLAPNWPKKFGGAEWNAVQRHIFEEEAAAHHAPRIVPFGLSMLAPVLQKFGSKEQQDYWLPRLLEGKDWWCQGYSEPGAGSDLASLKTRAVRDGDHYIVNGQKTWTTLGQHANMIFCLVRTDPDVKQQEGISFLLIDMNTPGIEVRPIILLDGAHEVNEVFFDEMAGGKPLMANPHFAARVAQVEIDLKAMATSNMRIISAAAAGGAPGVEASMLKVKGTIIRQEINDLARRAVGPYAMPFASEAIEGSNEALPDPHEAGPVAAQYFNNRKLSIFGGSNEIQRGIIAKVMMGGGK